MRQRWVGASHGRAVFAPGGAVPQNLLRDTLLRARPQGHKPAAQDDIDDDDEDEA